MRRILMAWLSALALVFSITAVSRADVKDVTVGCLGPACAFCNNMLEGKLRHIPGIQKVIANLKDSTFTLIPKSDQPLDLAAMKKAVNDSGYTFRYISLTVQGIVTDFGVKPAFKDPQTGQVFLLGEGENAPLSVEKMEELKSLSQDGEKPIEITGIATAADGLALLEPQNVAAAQD